MTEATTDTGSLPPDVQIRVDNRIINASEIDREVQYHSAPDLGEARRRAAQALVVRELLLAEADSQGIRDPEEGNIEAPDEARIRVLIERNVDIPEPGAAACRRYYDANPERMRTSDQHEVSHILIPAPADDAELRAEARKVAQTLTATLGKEPQRFQELARTHSSCPSSEVGGYLGLIVRGQTAPEFEKALSRLPVEVVPDYPVETRYGFHVVLIHARHSGRPLTFEACHERIADYLREHVRRRAISQYIRVLAADHHIEGFDLDAATSPLVQ
ncbi:MAG TPA: peptidylprolyl isomerase [Woeseiaceae bacterium]|nr:peptidylprolyl isomerase [Woeseiaceae bacterium]